MTTGWVCGEEGLERRLVLTTRPADCARHASIAAGGYARGALTLSLPSSAPATLEQLTEVCVEGRCDPRRVRVEIDALEPRLRGRFDYGSGDARVEGRLLADTCDYLAENAAADIDIRDHLEIEDMAIYQGVESLVVGRGIENAPEVPTIVGRPALLRVVYDARHDIIGRLVEGRLAWRSERDGATRVLTSTAVIFRTSRSGTLNSTLNFDIPAEAMTDVVDWSLEVRPWARCPPPREAERPPLRSPSRGVHRLNNRRVGALHVTLVPFRYWADESGRLPSLSPDQLAAYRDALFTQFPVEDVRLEVREPVDWFEPVVDRGSWSRLLTELLTIRAEDDPPPATYYYGLVQPTESLRQLRGVAGVAPVPAPSFVALRGGVGIGHPEPNAEAVMAHELGHAMGRLHAPCGGPERIDPDFPWENYEGTIGSWGFDLVERVFHHPNRTKDFMSYCGPEWVSDYTYRGLAERLAFVNGAARLVGAETAVVRMLTSGPGGPAVTRAVELALPQGERVRVRYLDARMSALDEGEAVEVELDHASSPMWMVPEGPLGTAFVQLGREPLVPWPASDE